MNKRKILPSKLSKIVITDFSHPSEGSILSSHSLEKERKNLNKIRINIY